MMFYDAVVIGAGMAGLYQLHRLRQLGLTVRVFERNPEVGGTWYNNAYPGCGFDSESYSYGYSFSPEILRDWTWTRRFALREETLRYVNFVADRLDLRRDIEFQVQVVAARYDAAGNRWCVELKGGRKVQARFLIAAAGPLSAAVTPQLPGRETFQGLSFHTFDWPRTPLDLTGKRVAVVGTGSSGIQVIQEVAKIAGQLTVFQREANWAAPLHDSPISAAEMAQIRSSYAAIFARCRDSLAGFIHLPDTRSALEVSSQERESLFEKLYNEPGFGIWLGNFHDIATDARAAALISDFIARKIRQRVRNPRTAELLIPKDHYFGTKRVALESGFYEAFNRPNVDLIDVNATPIDCITPRGIQVGGREIELDVIVYATGFDAFRGSLDRIDIRGIEDRKLFDKWADGPTTYLGLAHHGFPNLFTVIGPQSGGTSCNYPRCIEHEVGFITALLVFMQERGYIRLEATAAAERAWTDRVNRKAGKVLAANVNSYANSINPNLPGRNERRTLVYFGGLTDWLRQLDDIAAHDYKGFTFARREVDADPRQLSQME